MTTRLTQEKQARLDTEWKAKKAAAKRQKELQEMRRRLNMGGIQQENGRFKELKLGGSSTHHGRCFNTFCTTVMV